MSSTRIPSPAHSQGVMRTPRQRRYRASRSVGSPACSTTSIKLSTIVQENQMDKFVLSPLRTRRSVLSDNTDIEIPSRKSWWKRLNEENTKDVIEFIENREQEQAINVEEFIDFEILSPEKRNYTIDLPESSDGESIRSIVLPQRKIFKQKDKAEKVYQNVMDNRENLEHFNDNTIHIGKKNLFNRGNKERSKPVFPAALLNMSPDKTIRDKDISRQGKMRNLFGNRQGSKRKNMFAEFVVSESEDEISDIQTRVFGFAKNSEHNILRSSASERVRETSPTSDITDTEMDDWKLLPSSTMLDNQFGNLESNSNTPVKKAKVSQLSENLKKDRSKADIRNKSKQTDKSVISPKNLSISQLSENVENDGSKADIRNKSKQRNKSVMSSKNLSLNQLIENVGNDRSKADIRNKSKQTDKSVMSSKNLSLSQLIENVGNDRSKADIRNKSKQTDKSVMSSKNLSLSQLIENVGNDRSKADIKNKSKQTNKSVMSPKNRSESSKFRNVEVLIESLHSECGDVEKEVTLTELNVIENNQKIPAENSRNLNIPDIKTDKSIKDVITNNNQVDNHVDNHDFTLQYESDEGNNNLENLNDDYNATLKPLETTKHNTLKPLETTNNANEKDEATLKDKTLSEHNVTNNDKRSTREMSKNNKTITSPDKSIKRQSVSAINERRPSLAPFRESTRLSDGTEGSSIERSGWDSHRTTRKTLRKTFGKDFTPRKSLRTLVMERAAKRQTYGFDITTKMPQACSTRLAENMHSDSVRDNDAPDNNVIEHRHKSDVCVEENVKISVAKNGEHQNIEIIENIVSHKLNSTDMSKQTLEDNTQVKLPQTHVHVEKESDEQNRDFQVIDHFVEIIEKRQHIHQNKENIQDKRDSQDIVEKEINETRRVSLNIQEKETNKERRNSQDVYDGKINQNKIDSQVIRDEESEEIDEENGDSQNIQREENGQEKEKERDSQSVQEEEIDEEIRESEHNEEEGESNEEIREFEDNEEEVESDEGRRDSLDNESEERRYSSDNDVNQQTDADEDDELEQSSNIQDSHNINNGGEIDEKMEDIQGVRSDEDQNNESEEEDMRDSKDIEEESEKENIVFQNVEMEMSEPRYFMNDSTRELSSNMTEESDHDVSRMRRQSTLKMCLQKIKQQNLQNQRQAAKAVRNFLKELHESKQTKFNDFKVPLRPIAGPRRIKPAPKAAGAKPRAKSNLMGVGNLPPEILEDLKYKPPRRYRPANASWITKRLYKFLETKLEPKYDYKARVRAEQLAETLYKFTMETRRRNVADPDAVDALKLEMARLNIVTTHLDFHQFFRDFMPREIRIKVIPDIVNKIALPKHGIFSNIIR